MSDLKFNCPSCGQHVQCDESHAGENLPCPGCAQLIRVPHDADIVREPPPTPPSTVGAGISEVPTLEDNFLAESGTPLPAPPPVTEREAQLAAARAAHAAQTSKAIKPRLSFILSGGEAPPPEENAHALDEGSHNGSEQPTPESETKTLHE